MSNIFRVLMEQKQIKFVWTSVRTSKAKWLMSLWICVQFYDTFSSQIIPEQFSQYLQPVYAYVEDWSFSIWLNVLLLILIWTLIENGSRQIGVMKADSLILKSANSNQSSLASPANIKIPHSVVEHKIPDAAKIACIDEVWNYFHSVMLPIYDDYCDKFGNWKLKINEGGTEKYFKDLNAHMQFAASALSSFYRLAEDHEIFSDIYQIVRSDKSHGELVTAARSLQSKVTKLPPEPTADQLELLDSDGETFKNSIGNFGRWIRGSKKQLSDLRKVETGEKLAS